MLKSSAHHFFLLSSRRCIDLLEQWVHAPGRLQPEVLNKIKEWFAVDEHGHGGLADWDISRDAPYFGIRIPDTEDKYFYVWLDAPVGYLASLKNLFDREGRDFDAFMADPKTEQVHFIGKDITYFHTLFWPAMLHFSGRKTPDRIYRARFHHRQRREDEQEPRHRNLAAQIPRTRHGRASGCATTSPPSSMRSVEDIEFNPDDFVARVNSDLVGKYINIASRAAGFLAKRFDGRLAADAGAEGSALLAALRTQAAAIAALVRRARIRQGDARSDAAGRPGQ